MKPRAKLRHVLLDVNLPSHHKVRSLKRVHGVAAKASLYEAYSAMAAATNAVIDKDALLSIAEENEVANPEGWIGYCVERGLIIEEMGGYSNQPVIDDQESYGAKLERDRKRKSGDAPAPSVPLDSERIPLESKRNAPPVPAAPDTDFDTDIDIESIKENGAPPAGIDPDLWAETENQFPPDEHPACQRDTRFLGAGRKPLKKYPEIWLTRLELYNWLKCYLDAGVPKNRMNLGFLKVQSKLMTYSAEKRRVQSVSAFNWGIGFVLKEVLEELKASTDLKRSEIYLKGASQ